MGETGHFNLGATSVGDINPLIRRCSPPPAPRYAPENQFTAPGCTDLLFSRIVAWREEVRRKRRVLIGSRASARAMRLRTNLPRHSLLAD
jgi:hypothetical protein